MPRERDPWSPREAADLDRRRSEVFAAVLARAQGGDSTACRDLIEAHQARIFAQLRGMLRPVGRGSAVEDLAQETLLRAFRALPRFSGSSRQFRSWLLTIATRLALNELRRRGPPEVFDTIAERRQAPAATASALIGRGLESAVRDLPDAYRAAFLLRELHGLEYAEIAEALDIDVGTVKSRLFRARTRLRSALAEIDHE